MADKKLIIGFETNCVPDLNALLDDARKDQFDFLTVPLVHPRFKRDALGVSSKREDPLTRSDFLLDSRQWSSLIVGKISEWLDMDSSCEASALAGELAFKQEMAWATHLALAAVVAPTPAPGRCSNYARCINQVVQELTYMAVWLRIPLIHPEALEPDLGDSDDQDVGVDVLAAEGDQGSQRRLAGDGDEHALGEGEGDDSEAQNGKRKGQPQGQGQGQPQGQGRGQGKGKVGGVEDPWETWNTVRVLCEHKGCLSVALEITEDLPPQNVLDRWVGEPVKAVIVPTRVFLTNRKGFPTLSRRHQDFVTAMIKQKTQFVVKGRSQHPSGYLPYLQYLEHLRTRLPPPKKQDAYETPYYDYLQAPLQPLADNLESQTYEAFEKDPVKYAQYERAVVKALELEKEKHKDRDITVLMVVGAGRGPLVQASLNAGVDAGRALKVYAVEKNPNAVITLRNRAIMNGWDNVTIVGKDMRHWEPAEKADILVSELLGSWGDNELSPECLDGAQRFLKEGGVSIPQEYTSWVAPMSSHKLWREVSNFEELKRLETAYVVKLHNFLQLAEEKPCFAFRHPNPDINSEGNNKRHIEVHFDVHQASTLHGFAGFFDSRLFADIHISIVPATFSEGMFSWFPLYIPLRTPVVLKPGDKVSVHFWRCTSSTKAKVWYEWALTSPSPSPIHNPNGRSYWIGL